MDSKSLSFFIKLYEKRSLRQAANELFITPQGLSRSLQSLENELDSILFERTTQGLLPTKAGDYLYENAKELLEAYNQIQLNLKTLNGKNRELSFVCSYGIMNALPYEKFIEFEQEHPDYQIRWHEFPDAQTMSLLQGDEYNLGLIIADNPSLDENYKVEHLFSRRPVLLVYEGHRLYSNTSVSLGDLIDEPIIMEGKDFYINQIFRKKCIEYGFCPNIIIETGDISFCHKLCSMKQGIGVTIDFVADFVKAPNIRAIEFDTPDFFWKVYLAYHKKRVLSPPAKQFCEFLLSTYPNSDKN